MLLRFAQVVTWAGWLVGAGWIWLLWPDPLHDWGMWIPAGLAILPGAALMYIVQG
jgi:hypothetical protein